MKAIIELPEFFIADPDSNIIQVQDLSFVRYSAYTRSFKNRIHVNKCMFVHVLEGQKVLHTADRYIHVKAGQAFIAGKGTYMTSEIISTRDNTFKSMVFFFDDAFLSRFLREKKIKTSEPMDSEDYSGIMPIEVTPLLKASIDSVLPYFKHKASHAKFVMRLKLEEILLNMYHSEKKTDIIPFISYAVNDQSLKLEQIMLSNLTEPYTVNDYAALVGRSLSAFKKDFQVQFGMPPKTWINNERLKLARFMLEHSEKNVTEICMDVGFQSISHFIQVFKKSYGVTPKQIQKMQINH